MPERRVPHSEIVVPGGSASVGQPDVWKVDEPTQKVERPSILDLPEAKEATELIGVLDFLSQRRYDLDPYLTRLSYEYKALTERVQDAPGKAEVEKPEAVRAELQAWIAQAKKIEKAWIKDGPEEMSLYDRGLRDKLPATADEVRLYERIYQGLQSSKYGGPRADLERDRQRFKMLMDAKLAGEDLDNVEVAQRVEMHYREQGELDYYRTVYMHEGRQVHEKHRLAGDPAYQ